MVANAARFKITGSIGGLSPSVDVNGNKGYFARAGETLTLQLEDNPPVANSVTFDLFDINNPKSPAASFSAVNKAFFGLPMIFAENTLPSYTLPSPGGTATMVMFDGSFIGIEGPMCWIVRATATLANGVQHVYERGIALAAFPSHFREPVFGERDQFSKFGWGFDPLGHSMQNSFPQQSQYAFGQLNSISHANVDIVPGTSGKGVARTLIAVAQVWGREDAGATQGLWGLRRVAFIDAAGTVTLSTNAGGETLDGTILETRFQPSIVINGTSVSVKMDQKIGGHTYDWECWYTLMEARR